MTLSRVFSLGYSLFAICGRTLALISSFALAACGDNLSADPAYVTMARPQIMQLLSDTQTSGAVGYVESPNGNWSESFGRAQCGTSTPIPTDANFRVDSVTKTWTATVILQLVQEGKPSLSDTVGKYIPNALSANEDKKATVCNDDQTRFLKR